MYTNSVSVAATEEFIMEKAQKHNARPRNRIHDHSDNTNESDNINSYNTN